MIDLKKIYGKKYRIFMDEAWAVEDSQSNPDKVKDKPWYYEIRGKYGKIYLYSTKDNILAVHINSNVISNKIERENTAILSLYMKTEEGSVFLFKPETLEFVAKIIKARKKRQISEKQKAVLVERIANYQKILHKKAV